MIMVVLAAVVAWIGSGVLASYREFKRFGCDATVDALFLGYLIFLGPIGLLFGSIVYWCERRESKNRQ